MLLSIYAAHSPHTNTPTTPKFYARMRGESSSSEAQNDPSPSSIARPNEEVIAILSHTTLNRTMPGLFASFAFFVRLVIRARIGFASCAHVRLVFGLGLVGRLGWLGWPAW